MNIQRFNRDCNQDEPLFGLQVLLVEDDLDMAVLLLFILEAAGAEVVLASRSIEALSILVGFRPHVLISNVRLLDYNGDWLIRKIRQLDQDEERRLPAIAITSYTREVADWQMLDAGFERFLDKSIEQDELISTILDLVSVDLKSLLEKH